MYCCITTLAGWMLLSGFSSEWLQQFTRSVCMAWLQRTSLNCVRLSLRQQVVVVGFGPPQPAIWSYHAADCQPTAHVLSVSLVQSAATLYQTIQSHQTFLSIVLGNS